MTRAFGDAKLKDHITVEPNVTIEKIDKDTDFIILASDGLWKVVYSAIIKNLLSIFNMTNLLKTMMIHIFSHYMP